MEHGIGDDDDYHFHDFSPQQQRLLDPVDSSTIYGIMLTVFCIVVLQFRATIAAWFRDWRQQGWREALWGFWEATCVNLYALHDVMRFMVPCLDDHDENHAMIVHRRLQAMPKLEGMTENVNENETHRERRTTMEELEPAFLRIEDYPPGWMVYDSEVGVILKTEFDELEKKRRQQKSQRRNETPLDEYACGETRCATDSVATPSICKSKLQTTSRETMSQPVPDALAKQSPTVTGDTETVGRPEVKPEQTSTREAATMCRTDLEPPTDHSPPIPAA